MDELFAKMSEFVEMEEELPFADFQAYFQQVMTYLQREYQNLSQEDLLRAKGILMIMAANASSRAQRKDANRKKFAKMAEKSSFWDEAIKLNLTKSGMTANEIDEKIASLWD